MDIPKLKGDAKYKDAPRFKLIYVYEGEAKARYKTALKGMLSAVDKNLRDLLK